MWLELLSEDFFRNIVMFFKSPKISSGFFPMISSRTSPREFSGTPSRISPEIFLCILLLLQQLFQDIFQKRLLRFPQEFLQGFLKDVLQELLQKLFQKSWHYSVCSLRKPSMDCFSNIFINPFKNSTSFKFSFRNSSKTLSGIPPKISA